MPRNAVLVDYLKTRRSVGIGFSPSRALRPPSSRNPHHRHRVPDHGKYAPWRLVVFEGDARAAAGEKLAAIAKARRPDLDEASLDIERNQFLPAPLTVGVLLSPKPSPKAPEIEQLLSAGNVCFALEHAAFALGFAATWHSRWYSFDPEAQQMLGAKGGDASWRIISAPRPSCRRIARPVLADVVTPGSRSKRFVNALRGLVNRSSTACESMGVQPINIPPSLALVLNSAGDRSGVDFDYLLQTAIRESSLNPAAKAQTSSATGLFQFIESTWLEVMKDEGPRLGYQKYADAITTNADGDLVIRDKQLRQEVLALREDPQIAADLAAAFTRKNGAYLFDRFGRMPSRASSTSRTSRAGRGGFFDAGLANPTRSRRNFFRGRPRPTRQSSSNCRPDHQRSV